MQLNFSCLRNQRRSGKETSALCFAIAIAVAVALVRGSSSVVSALQISLYFSIAGIAFGSGVASKSTVVSVEEMLPLKTWRGSKLV